MRNPNVEIRSKFEKRFRARVFPVFEFSAFGFGSNFEIRTSDLDEPVHQTSLMTENAPRISTEVQVMFFDTDCAAVVHNIAYLRFIETARTLLAEELGMRLTEMAGTQCYPVVVRTEIDYRRAALLGDRLRVEGWLDQLERARFWCAFQIRRVGDDALIAECRQMLALIQMPEARLLRLPQEWNRFRTRGPVVTPH
jgi:acyl-CoA thioester hydrolase